VEFIAGSLGGERGFSPLSLPRGFRTRRGERRSATLPRFENLMIFLFENIEVWHHYFYAFRKVKRRTASSELRMGSPTGTIRHPPSALR
jgi:hypothetical protein